VCVPIDGVAFRCGLAAVTGARGYVGSSVTRRVRVMYGKICGATVHGDVDHRTPRRPLLFYERHLLEGPLAMRKIDNAA